MKIHGTATGAAVSKKDFGVAFGGAAAADIYPDSGGSDMNISETNCTLNTSGEILGTGCLSFNGSSAYGDCDGDPVDYNFLTQAFSLSMWVYPTITHQDILFDSMDASTANVGFLARFNVAGGTNKLMVGISDGTTFEYFETTDVWTDDEWQHLVITYNGTTMTVYRNTTSIGSGSVAKTTSTPAYAPRLGWAANATDNKYEGLIDDMVLFNNRMLSSAEISSLYNSGSGELVSTVFAAGDRSGLKAYYNMDAIDSNVVINNAIPTS